MDLRHHAAAPALKPRGEADPPERPVARQAGGERAVAQEREAAIVEPVFGVPSSSTWPRHVKVRVVHPERLAETGRRVGEPAPEARDVLEPGRDAAPQPGERGPRDALSHPEGGAPRHVHVRVGRLEAEERAVDRGEALWHGNRIVAGRAQVIRRLSKDRRREFDSRSGGQVTTTARRRARIAAAGELARRRVAGHGLDAAEVEIALVPALHAQPVARERGEGRPRRLPARRPPRRPRSARAGASTASCAEPVVDHAEDRLQDRRADPVRAGATRARPRAARRAAPRSGPSCSAPAPPASWRWKPSGFRSSSPSMLLRCIPVPGHDHARAGAVGAGDARARAVRVHHRDVGGGAQPRRDLSGHPSSASSREEALEVALGVQALEELLVARAVGRGDHLGERARVARAVDPLEQLERVGDQDAAGGGRRVGEHVASAVVARARAGARSTS